MKGLLGKNPLSSWRKIVDNNVKMHAIHERVLETANVSKGAIVGENHDSNDSGAVCYEENTLHVDDIELNFVYENACAETDASCDFGGLQVVMGAVDWAVLRIGLVAACWAAVGVSELDWRVGTSWVRGLRLLFGLGMGYACTWAAAALDRTYVGWSKIVQVGCSWVWRMGWGSIALGYPSNCYRTANAAVSAGHGVDWAFYFLGSFGCNFWAEGTYGLELLKKLGFGALELDHLRTDSDESTPNSAESTQPSLPRYDELHKFFLADSTPTMVRTLVDIDERPTLIFNDMETLSFTAAYRYALVGKFSYGAPQYQNLHCLIARLGIKCAFTISMINAKHVLISLSNEADLSHLWLRRIWHVQGFPMRVFKWTPTFTLEQESSIVPVWVCFPKLLAHLFHKDALFAVASMIGTPLQIDDFTFNHSKLSKARVGIEINLTKPLVEEFDLKINGITIRQKVEYEQVPKYCNLCKHVGHENLECYSKGNAPLPPQRKWKKVAKHSKFKEKMTTDECVFMEKGECSKSAEDCHRYVSEAVLNSQKEIGEVCNHEVEINHADNDDFVAGNDVFAAENENSVAENDSIRVIENVVELEGNGNDRNDTIDGETIDVTCGGGPVGDCNNMDATKGMEIQLFYQAVKPIVTERKGKSLNQMKTK
ncbi:hypothetical protein Sango_2502700 [Sesamum angolense]|uniref:DUF4283 domain-containing protein n=1 Tax=Sesamum angolense TaxID=2727404 RepID=A0AAE1W3Z1_9LAMI|nr:hypothetical protein Sango_2502700 [Sesamum angolense]